MASTAAVRPPSLPFVALETSKPDPGDEHSELFRQFGVQLAPVLYPTEDEFADPNEYLRKNHALGEEYGILKIIPPKSWRPDFSLDRDTFSFDCRKQDVSSLSVVNRTAKDYAERLTQFHAMVGRYLAFVPLIGPTPVPYHSINRTVQDLGGIATLDNQSLWGRAAALLGLPPNAAMILRQIYWVDVYPFEAYCRDVRKRADFLFDGDDDSDGSEDEEDEDEEDEDEEDEEEESDDEGHGYKQPSTKDMSFGYSNDTIPPFDKDMECMICKNTETNVGCCRCQEYAHLSCVAGLCPGLQGLPKWYCPKCLAEPARFYFDSGRSYTLNEFEERAGAFEASVLDRLNARRAPEAVKQALLEREFWKLVDSAQVKFYVEYGAEIRCDEKGSGFPKQGAYKDDPWNLNNLPDLKESLFKYVDEPISGVTIPWAYVGMTFSAFCWHTEDNFCYSVNYQHLGAPKTWYGIPSRWTAQFEHLSEQLAPEPFRELPDLFNERSSLVSPQTLSRHGIPVYGANQKPGEFVVTFPNVYHAGFNQGFNFNEAVNYIPTDWVPYGFLALEVYRTRKHVPTFCHESILMRAIRNEEVPGVLKDVIVYYQRMVKDELARRNRYRRASGRKCNETRITQRAADASIQKSSFTCTLCKTIPYLSRVYTRSGHYYCTECATGRKSDVIYGVFETLNTDDSLKLFGLEAKKRLHGLE